MRQSTSISYFEQLKTIFWLFWLTHVFLPISLHFPRNSLHLSLSISHLFLYSLLADSFDFVFGHSSTNNKILLKIYERNSYAKRWNLFSSQVNKQANNRRKNMNRKLHTKIGKRQSEVKRRRSKLRQSQNSHASATIELTYNFEQ